jgi:thiol-disulfide isomerase/thioredoxin
MRTLFEQKQNWGRIFVSLAIGSSILLGLFVLPRLSPRPQTLGQVVKDVSLPLVELQHAEGSRFKLSAYQGKVLVLDFWATWCGPCRDQSKILERFVSVPRANVAVVGVNEGESLRTVTEFLRSHPAPYPIAMDEDGAFGESLKVQGLPTVVVINPKGELVNFLSGVVSYGRLESMVKEAAR